MSERIALTKAEALRNDFIVVRESRSTRRWTPSRVAAICDRRRGVGADGLVILGPRRRGRIPFTLCNSDGSRAEWSGNGVRCAAAVLAGGRRRPAGFALATAVGIIDVDVRPRAGNDVTASFARPAPAATGLSRVRLRQPQAVMCAWRVDAGNPHWVFQVRDFDFDWDAFGRECQTRARATRGVNVEFVRVVNRRAIDMRIYERGVGPTPSSGSGALAAVAACRHHALIGERVSVAAPGGMQIAHCDTKTGSIELAAVTRVVFRGVWDM